ncbi:MAG: FAD-dependent monooxygenase [Acidimicrobiales bacterium]
MRRTTRVAVIGGGIGGLSAAHALRRRGFEVSVYEASPELREIGAGVALGPNAMKALRSVGLEEPVREIGWEPDHTMLHNGITGRVISKTSRASAAEAYGASGCMIHRADLLDRLATNLPGVLVELAARCDGARTEGDVAIAHFSDGREIEADVVVGADGIHSAVRESLFGVDAPRFTGKICYRSIVPSAAVADVPEIHDGTWLGPHGTIVTYRVRRGELVNVVCHYDDEHYKHESWITQCDKSEVVERYSRWHDALKRLFSAGELWYKWALYDRDPIPEWTAGRVTLLGDSAHAMLPYLGQGAGQAIEDGCILATALGEIPEDAPMALRLYERVRRPRASRVVLASRARGVDNHLSSPIAALRRDLRIAFRKRFTGNRVSGRADDWIPAYDAGSHEVLSAG